MEGTTKCSDVRPTIFPLLLGTPAGAIQIEESPRGAVGGIARTMTQAFDLGRRASKLDAEALRKELDSKLAQVSTTPPQKPITNCRPSPPLTSPQRADQSRRNLNRHHTAHRASPREATA